VRVCTGGGRLHQSGGSTLNPLESAASGAEKEYTLLLTRHSPEARVAACWREKPRTWKHCVVTLSR
jgi:hypothetical protein